MTGDFNLDINKASSSRKIHVECLCKIFGMSQIIINPTHFTETSQSLIDIFLVTNPDDVVDCGVVEPFLNQLVRYHCSMYCILRFHRQLAPTYKRKVWKFSNGDYPKLRGIVLIGILAFISTLIFMLQTLLKR